MFEQHQLSGKRPWSTGFLSAGCLWLEYWLEWASLYIYIYWELGTLPLFFFCGGALFSFARLRTSKILAGHTDTVLTVAMKGNIAAWPTAIADLTVMATTWGSGSSKMLMSIGDYLLSIMLVLMIWLIFIWYHPWTMSWIKLLYRPHGYHIYKHQKPWWNRITVHQLSYCLG